MSNTLTPAQKALVKAQNLQAELDCSELQTVKRKVAVVNARTRMHVAAETRTERIQGRLADRLAMVAAVDALPENVRTKLTSTHKSEKETKGKSKGSNGAQKSTQTDASVQ
jgi:hypothetical protein